MIIIFFFLHTKWVKLWDRSFWIRPLTNINIVEFISNKKIICEWLHVLRVYFKTQVADDQRAKKYCLKILFLVINHDGRESVALKREKENLVRQERTKVWCGQCGGNLDNIDSPKTKAIDSEPLSWRPHLFGKILHVRFPSANLPWFFLETLDSSLSSFLIVWIQFLLGEMRNTLFLV